MQIKLTTEEMQTKPKLYKPYAKGFYNKANHEEQWIRLTEGCPNRCEFCRESWENGVKPIYYTIPEITRNCVKILDMNITYKDKFLDIINELGTKKVDGKVVYYELTCGIDYRFMNQDKANALYKNRFLNIRIAWDGRFTEQKKVKSVVDMLIKSGYKSNDIMVFMICNWKIPYIENIAKMDLCKVWRVKVHDAYFDNQLPPDIKPIHWNIDDIKDFRAKTRKHNQIVNFGIDPEVA